jgi:hypothetical protein
VPYGTGPSFTPFPGISCQATIAKSLRDNKLSALREIDSTSRRKFEDDDEYEDECRAIAWKNRFVAAYSCQEAIENGAAESLPNIRAWSR